MQITLGQYSHKGCKASNQDFHGFLRPTGPQLEMKGIAFAMADGISTSEVSHIASETAVRSFLDDYFCTSEAWSVRHAGEQVLNATNSWLHAQTRNSEFRYLKDKGYVCTLSALVLKGTRAHLFHVGDTRIYRLQNHALEQLTNDHRLWVSQKESYLSRAMGADSLLEIDYQSVPVRVGDVFILATDGIYEHIQAQQIIALINAWAEDPDMAAQLIADQALQQGSNDNLSIQIIRIQELPGQGASEVQRQIDTLPFPPLLKSGDGFEGYTVLRQVHASSRSHVYLALDQESDTQVILKTPSMDLRGDPGYLERFLTEEWIARRVNSGHVMKAGLQSRKRHFLYTVTEYIPGQTLRQWLADHPKPELETVRNIIEQIARGLYALHRREILHQDIRPDNIMIDRSGSVKIIDFGSARVAGLEESMTLEPNDFPGTALYMAPEYFMGETGTPGSDLYSLGVLAYHMLCGDFPYGTQVAKARTVADQWRLNYTSVLDDHRTIPSWVDETLRKAVHPNPNKRYQEISEFTADLRHPNPSFINRTRPPLIERSPVAFWQGLSAILAVVVVYLLLNH
ncbi:MAG: bifunctional protein-serine/threonine kinase/phosphatase [Halomonadaceae bacterium]|nr:MAG: bifunctional protein-serine/threonine kinase/phosphatase [Halomonadaceae bacterium]